MCVIGNGGVGCGDEEAASHAEVHDPLRFRRGLLATAPRFLAAQFADDMFPGAMDGEEVAAFQALRLTGGGGFEESAMAGKPDIGDAMAAHTLVDAAGYGFDFGQFGHFFIVGGGTPLPPVWVKFAQPLELPEGVSRKVIQSLGLSVSPSW